MPLPSLAAATVPLVICEPASETASEPPLEWLLAWAVGNRESESRESFPTQTLEAVVPVVIPSTAAELVPLFVSGAVTEITPEDPVAPESP